MTDLEKAEILREKTGISYTEAKEALDNTNGSMLDALVYLEKQGKVETPPGGGFYSGAGPASDEGEEPTGRRSYAHEGESFSDMVKRFGRFCMRLVEKGIANSLVATRKGEQLFSLPVIAFVVLLIFFWVTLPLFVITLFCGIRYHFQGPDLDRDLVNNVMSTASDMAEDVKRTFTEEVKATKEAHEAKKASEAAQNAQSANGSGSPDENPSKDDDEVIYY